MIYLASPYTHDDPEVVKERYAKTCKVAGILIREGYRVFSPIAHTHAILVVADLPGNFAFHRDLNFHMIDLCSGFFVLRMNGWEESVGVRAETDYLLKNRMGIGVRYILADETIQTNDVVFT